MFISILEREMREAAADLAENLSVNNAIELRQIIEGRLIDGLNRAGRKAKVNYLSHFISNGLIDEILDEAVAKWKEGRPAMYLEIKSRLKEIRLDPAAFADKIFNRMIFSCHKRVYFHLVESISAADREICLKTVKLLRDKFPDNSYLAELTKEEGIYVSRTN